MRIRMIVICLVLAVLAGCTAEKPSVTEDQKQPDAQNEQQLDTNEAPGHSQDQNDVRDDSESEQDESTSQALDQDQREDSEEPSDPQDEFLAQFFGTWSHHEESDIRLELQNGSERVGVERGQLMSRAEFAISEVNESEQYIVIEGTREMVSYDEEAEKIPFASKIYLEDGGSTLRYVFDYLDSQVESIWVKP